MAWCGDCDENCRTSAGGLWAGASPRVSLGVSAAFTCAGVSRRGFDAVHARAMHACVAAARVPASPPRAAARTMLLSGEATSQRHRGVDLFTTASVIDMRCHVQFFKAQKLLLRPQ